MNTRNFFAFFFAIILTVGFTACLDEDFDTPPVDGVDPGLNPTMTIKDFKALHSSGSYETIDEDIIIGGVVVADDASGNWFRSFVLQDETGGIEILTDIADSYVLYPSNEVRFLDWMKNEDEGMRWWGVVGLHLLETSSKQAKEILHNGLTDPADEIKIMSAWSLVKIGERKQALQTLDTLLFQKPTPNTNTTMLHNVIDRAIQVHGALGVTEDTPLALMYREARYARIYDGPDEVHRMTVARRLLKDPVGNAPW